MTTAVMNFCCIDGVYSDLLDAIATDFSLIRCYCYDIDSLARVAVIRGLDA